MTRLASLLSKPTYVYRLDQFVRRIRNQRLRAAEPAVRVAWGQTLFVNPRDQVGNGILRTGVHELSVSETIWRLTERSDEAIDVGANLGYFTALLARRARSVVAMEPHPALRNRLERNVVRLGREGGRVTVDARAASDRTGTAILRVSDDFHRNQGAATLEGDGTGIAVETVPLDDVIGGHSIGVLKIDVEGHELPALHGAKRSLERRLIRDVLFEDHEWLPTPVSDLLEESGFTILAVEQAMRGPRLRDPATAHHGWDAPTYLATLDPNRGRSLLRPPGWHCLIPHSLR